MIDEKELTGWQLLAKYAADVDDDVTATELLFDDLGANPRTRTALFGLVLQAIRHERRHLTRNVERAARVETRNGLGVSHDAVLARKELREQTFALGDTQRVRWGEATVEQHRQRIEMLDAMRLGLEKTIARHAAAIEQIQAAGVTCLDEIEDNE